MDERAGDVGLQSRVWSLDDSVPLRKKKKKKRVLQNVKRKIGACYLIVCNLNDKGQQFSCVN